MPSAAEERATTVRNAARVVLTSNTATQDQARERIEAARTTVKKKRKPKSQRGKGSKKQIADSAVGDVMDMLGLSDDK